MVQGEMLIHKVGESLIPHRLTDGYINATVLCKACGKLVADYLRLDSTDEFLQALSKTMGIPIVSLVQVKTGRNGGTWVHPQVAVNLGQWCSARFAVLVSQWVFEWMTRGAEPAAPSPQPPPTPAPHRQPVYVRRLSLAYRMQTGVPEGYWTVFDKSSNLLILVECDLAMPVEEYDLLDGSVGIHWSKFREDQPWAGERIRYEHTFPDKRGVQQAWAYPHKELAPFDLWLRNLYIPRHLPDYLDRKYKPTIPSRTLISRALGDRRWRSLPPN